MAKLSEKNQKGSNASIHNSDSNISDGVMKMKRKRRSVKRDSPPQRSSIYRGVTRHRWTGRYEAHLWDKNCWNVSQNKKGRQVYLGAYDDEEVAAHAYDLAALKYWGKDTILNFPLSTYQKELEEMQCLSREEYIGSLRRKSSGFSRGVSKYRGVARHHHNGRWEARIGRVFGNKYLYLGTYATQEEAATAYDIAAIEYRGLNAVTNFDLSRYIKWLKPNHDQDNYNPNSHMINENPNLDTSNNYTDQDSFNLTLFNNLQQSSTKYDPNNDKIALALTQQQPPIQKRATSALGLLFQSSKFKEMIEMATSSLSSLSSVLPDDHDHHDDIDNHQHNSISTNPQLIDIEFENPNLLHDHMNFGYDQNSSSILDGDDDVSIFGDLNSIIFPPLFQLDFDI